MGPSLSFEEITLCPRCFATLPASGTAIWAANFTTVVRSAVCLTKGYNHNIFVPRFSPPEDCRVPALVFVVPPSPFVFAQKKERRATNARLANSATFVRKDPFLIEEELSFPADMFAVPHHYKDDVKEIMIPHGLVIDRYA